MIHALEVRLLDQGGGRKVGQLWRDERRQVRFAYDDDWLGSPTAMPLSLSLPLGTREFDGDEARSWFAHLLPEGEARVALARRVGVSAGNDLALLEAVAGDCAGAVSLSPTAGSPPPAGRYQVISDEVLKTLVAMLPSRPLLAGEMGLRMTLSGPQPKLPVRIVGGRLALPIGAMATTHIVKPAVAAFPGTVINEAFCMRLARAVGLTVPEITIREVTIREIDGAGSDAGLLYCIERYDRRVLRSGAVECLHQEDFCQALALPPEFKFEKEGGPALVDCFRLLRRRSTRPAADLRALIAWVGFNYLVANADAHAKNLTLLLLPDGPRLAPFHDLVCTALWPQVNDRLAMHIGGEERPERITARQWDALADAIGVRRSFVRTVLKEVVTAVDAGLERVRGELIAGLGQPAEASAVIERICAVLAERRERIVAIF